MRLIDADKVVKGLNNKVAMLRERQKYYFENELTSVANSLCSEIELYIHLMDLIESQPTDYDVDKVVEELDRLPQCSTWNYNSNNIDRIKAINIVKAGGINNNVSKKM